MRNHTTAALALPTMKLNTDSPPDTIQTKSTDELVLLRRIIAESKCFRGPARERSSYITAIPTLPTAAPNIPCAMKPKPNTKKIEDRAKPNRLRKIVAPLRLAMDKAARPVKL